MKVKFLPQDVELEIQPNQSVMNLAHEKGIFIKSVCNGMPSCAECRVRVVEGEHNVLPPSTKELSLIGTGYFIDQRRLSCQLLCFGDITVDLSEQVEKEKQGVGARKYLTRQKDVGGESHAVSGNLLEQDQQLVEEVASSSERKSESEANSGGAKKRRRRRSRRGGGKR